MLGTPPNCRPECVIHQECPSNRACIAQQCQDPCIGSCGFNARCIAQNHQPVCSCIEGFEGDPYASCTPRQSEYTFNDFLVVAGTYFAKIFLSNFQDNFYSTDFTKFLHCIFAPSIKKKEKRIDTKSLVKILRHRNFFQAINFTQNVECFFTTLLVFFFDDQ